MNHRVLLLPLLFILAACRTSAPAPTQKGPADMQGSTVSPRSSVVYILIDKDPITGEWKPSPDPAVVYSDQLVEWVALDPTLKIKIQWKNVSFDPPCNVAARRCGRKSYRVDKRTEARYGVRILGPDNIELAFIDPILDILPVVDAEP